MIRHLKHQDIPHCEKLVLDNWGQDAADRAHAQMTEMFHGGQHVPHFYVATDKDDKHILGFAGYRPSWIMRDAYDLIWVAVDPEARGLGIGRALTEKRLEEIMHRGGALVMLVTQKPEFFRRFGFDTAYHLAGGWLVMINQLTPVRM